MSEKNKMNTFIVSSPLQVINTKEAIVEFNIVNYKIIIAKGLGKKNNLFEVLSLLKLNNIFELEFQSLLSLIFKKDFYNNFKNNGCIFLGDFDDFAQKIILKKIKNKNSKVYLLDDGNNTIIAEYHSFKFSDSKKYKIKDRIKNIIINKIYLRDIDLNEYFKFSMFLKKSENTIVNKLNYLNTLIQNSNKSSLMKNNYLLGSDIVEIGLISIEKYFELIASNLSEINNERLFYCPHRGESKIKVSKLVETFNLKIIYINLPLELYFIKNNIIPRNVWGFGSTALFTVSKLYPSSVVYNIEWEKNISSIRIKQEYKLISDFYKKNGIICI